MSGPPAATGDVVTAAPVRCDACGHVAIPAERCGTPDCGHVIDVHDLNSKAVRAACSMSTGPKATPCGCPRYTPKETTEP